MEVHVKMGTRPPWVGLAAAVWVQVAAASAYTFPLYSGTLKSVLGYDQQQLTMLGVAADIGENFGIIPGILCNWFPPWFVLGIGALLCFSGFGVVWLAITQTIVGLPFWLLWIALLLGTNSSAWFITSVLVTNMKNFPLSRGTVSGLLKGYVGLSAAVFTQLYSGILKKSPTNLLGLLTLGLPAICLSTMYFVRPCTPATKDDEPQQGGHFLFTQIVSVVLAFYLLGTTIFDDFISDDDFVTYALFGVTVLLLLCPLAIPIKMTLFRSPKKEPHVDQLVSIQTLEPLLPPNLAQTYIDNSDDEDMASEDLNLLLAEGEGAVVGKKRRPRRGEDFEFLEALVKADFWLLFVAYFIGVGTGVTALNNLAQIGYAASVDDTTVLLCLFSLGNFFGRLGGGAVSENLVKSSWLVPRPVLMTCTQTIMAISFLLLALALNSSLYIATAFLGLCYGVQFSIMIPTTSELFGLKNFGLFYNFMSLGNPIGAFLFSGLLAGYLYDKEAATQVGTTCVGQECFRVTFLIMAGICVIGAFLTVILSVRIKPVYRMLYAGGSFRVARASLH